MSDRTCGGCRWFEADLPPDDDTGYCIRFPKRELRDDGVSACGEWADKEHAQPVDPEGHPVYTVEQFVGELLKQRGKNGEGNVCEHGLVMRPIVTADTEDMCKGCVLIRDEHDKWRKAKPWVVK